MTRSYVPTTLDLSQSVERIERELQTREARRVEAEMIRRGMMGPPPLFYSTLDQTPNLDFITVDPDGTPRLHCHKRQLEALNLEVTRLAVCAGWRSGKSSIGAPWMARRMRKHGPGDYLLAAPSFGLLDKFPVPAIDKFLGYHLGLGEVVGGSKGEFRVSEEGHRKLWPEDKWPAYDKRAPTRIIFGHAENPDSLAAATILDAWLDEPDQKRFRKESHDEILARLATTGGHVLYTTRPYRFGWFKDEVYDRGIRNRNARKKGLPIMAVDAGYEVIEFESIDNPKFSKEEDARAKATLPDWVYLMKFKGKFTRPAGAIYGCFLAEPDASGFSHVVPAGYIPDPKWRLYCGIDFGAPNFAAVFLAQEPGTNKVVAFAEYRPAESKKLADHVTAMHAVIRKTFAETAREWGKEQAKAKGIKEPTEALINEAARLWTRLPEVTVAGAKAEGQWRSELASAGWPAHPPDQPEVEVQITRVYAAFKEDRLFISDDCPNLLSDVKNISRPVDEDGNPMEGIEDEDTYHSHAACRYIVSYINQAQSGMRVWMM